MAQLDKQNGKSQIFKGKPLFLYNLSLYLSGLFLAHKRALTLIDLKDKESFLDVGCGTGRIILALNQKYKHKKLFGIDPSFDMIDLAKTKLGQTERKRKTPRNEISLKIAFGEDLPFVRDTFDFVNSSLAFHHIDEKDKIKTIQEIHRVLKSGGLFLLSDLGDRPRGIFSKIMYKLLVKNHAFTIGNLETAERELENLGFERIKTETTFGYLEHQMWAKKI